MDFVDATGNLQNPLQLGYTDLTLGSPDEGLSYVSKALLCQLGEGGSSLKRG